MKRLQSLVELTELRSYPNEKELGRDVSIMVSLGWDHTVELNEHYDNEKYINADVFGTVKYYKRVHLEVSI